MYADSETRRHFLAHLTSLGLGSTLLPSTLWAQLQPSPDHAVAAAITPEMIRSALTLAGRAVGPAKPTDSELNSAKALLAYTYLVNGKPEDARKLGLLHRSDSISMNPERLIGDAKALALSLVPNYVPGAPVDIAVQGESAYASMTLGAWSARQGHYISDHDVIIAEKLAHILSGGRHFGEQTVSEQYLLDLEREAFLSLCGHPKTQERMQYMLKTGKPLRN